jgi:hydrogenase expression/formation protein HypC
MCLAIPGKIIQFKNNENDPFRMAVVDYGGIKKEVNMYLLPEAKVGDYVVVHVGVGISIINEKEAEETIDLLRQMGDHEVPK